MPPLPGPDHPAEITLPPRTAQLATSTDVLVVGGAPAGIGAAIGAAEAGAEAVLVERYGFLGGNAPISWDEPGGQVSSRPSRWVPRRRLSARLPTRTRGARTHRLTADCGDEDALASASAQRYAWIRGSAAAWPRPGSRPHGWQAATCSSTRTCWPAAAGPDSGRGVGQLRGLLRRPATTASVIPLVEVDEVRVVENDPTHPDLAV
jgi:hypothetical protein